MINYVDAIRRESLAFATAVRSISLDDPVPSCPDWHVADLVWHLTDVQHFWACIVEGLLEDPDDVPPFERPRNDMIPKAFDAQSHRLITALSDRGPDDVCWSWADDGHSVGWVRRRQAHEALIHRVDAELAAGRPSPIDLDLAADGVDEILRVSIDVGNLPEWATFNPDGTTATVQPEGGTTYFMRFGRFTGDSPISGTSYDLPALQLLAEPTGTDAVIKGRPDDLDLWLWGRGPMDALTIEGDVSVARQLRDTAADATQ